MKKLSDCWISERASVDKPLNLLLTPRTASKNQGRNASELRTMTSNNVTVSFLSEDTAPDEYGGTFLFTF